jgi:oxygen-independent coproporphyrinogen III oxidase
MAGIYIHIPFCRKACHYCDFHFTTNQAGQGNVLKAMQAEMRLLIPEYLGTLAPAEQTLQTLYFGGGTPSLIPPSELDSLCNNAAMLAGVDLQSLKEFTLEANPDDVTPQAALAWRSMGVNRISLGIQTFNDALLAQLNRSHTSSQAHLALLTLKQAGFANISADLIFALPGQNMESLSTDLDNLLSYELPHISLYNLTLEPDTVLGRLASKGQIDLPTDSLAADMMAYIMARLASEGYRQYEVSNFARPGFESLHNSSYWLGTPYLGIGPGAHSYYGENRYANIRSNGAYIEAFSDENSPALYPRTEETLTGTDVYNERILTLLRLDTPLDLLALAQLHAHPLAAHTLPLLLAWEKEGLIERSEPGNPYHIRLLPPARLLTDGMAERLFI